MTYLACPIIIPLLEAVEECLAQAREAKEDGARLIEWRIDALEPSEEVAKVITRLVEEWDRGRILNRVSSNRMAISIGNSAS